jgi:hypothetical protein
MMKACGSTEKLLGLFCSHEKGLWGESEPVRTLACGCSQTSSIGVHFSTESGRLFFVADREMLRKCHEREVTNGRRIHL